MIENFPSQKLNIMLTGPEAQFGPLGFDGNRFYRDLSFQSTKFKIENLSDNMINIYFKLHSLNKECSKISIFFKSQKLDYQLFPNTFPEIVLRNIKISLPEEDIILSSNCASNDLRIYEAQVHILSNEVLQYKQLYIAIPLTAIVITLLIEIFNIKKFN